MSAPTDQTLLVIDPQASRRLFQFGVGCVVAACAWFLWDNSEDLALHVLISIASFVLATLPALLWAKRQSSWFPAFEISCLVCGAFYALPMLMRHDGIEDFRPEVLNQAAFAIFTYLAMANLGFAVVRARLRAPYWASASLLPLGFERFVSAGMGLTTAYLLIQFTVTVIPVALEGPLRAFFYGLGTICTFVLSRSLGLGTLPPRLKTWFGINLALQIIIIASQLYLIQAISLLALAAIAYSSGSRRIPWKIMLVVVPLLAILHSGKGTMREIYWHTENARPGLLSLPRYYAEWIGYGLRPAEDQETRSQRVSIFERASLIQMVCLSVDRVPSLKPHLEGESYIDIPAMLVPRFLWPDKPSSLLANVRMALYFDLVSAENAMSVSIAFGMISEAYVNFGFLGVALLGVIFGAALKRIALLADGAPPFSALGILMILLTAWSFQVEFVAATWIASLVQSVVVCIAIPLAYRRFTTS